MTIPLQTGIVYGPVDSRRFGRSLGINLISEDRKICNFECLYCQYGDSKKTQASAFPSLDQIREEVSAVFSYTRNSNISYDWITIAGNGEPTLHPHFAQAVELLIRLRDQYLYAVPIGILSNASTCHRPEIQQSLLKLDGQFMKLDAGNQKLFETLNRPASSCQWTKLVHGLYEMRRIVIQSMFVKGRIDNTSAQEIDEWIKAVHYIQPEAVQIYTVDRLPQHSDVLPVSEEGLNQIAKRLSEKTRIPAFVYG